MTEKFHGIGHISKFYKMIYNASEKSKQIKFLNLLYVIILLTHRRTFYITHCITIIYRIIMYNAYTVITLWKDIKIIQFLKHIETLKRRIFLRNCTNKYNDKKRYLFFELFPWMSFVKIIYPELWRSRTKGRYDFLIIIFILFYLINIQ